MVATELAFAKMAKEQGIRPSFMAGAGLAARTPKGGWNQLTYEEGFESG
jgi:hypothetical protein